MNASSTTPRKRKSSEVSPDKDESSSSCCLEDILSPNGAQFSICMQPLLMGEFNGNPDESPKLSGCVVRMHSTKKTIHHPPITAIYSTFVSAMEKIPKKSLLTVLRHLLEYQAEDSFDALQASEKYLECQEVPAGYDEMTWFSTPTLLEFSLLRRLAMPMYMTWDYEPFDLIEVKSSFLDLILTTPCLRDSVYQSILYKIKNIETRITGTWLQTDSSSSSLKHLKKLQNLLIQTIKQYEIQDTTCISHIEERRLEKILRSSYCIHSVEETRKTLAVRAERQRIVDDLERAKHLQKGKEESNFSVSGHNELSKKRFNGTLLVTGGKMSYHEFCRQRDHMKLVNQTFPKSYQPGISRPRFRRVSISRQALDDLRDVFFDKDGSLKKRIQRDVDFTARNGYINFANVSCTTTRADKRWQVPLKRHSNNNRSVRSRVIVEDLLERQKVVDLSVEAIHDLGILIGGTEDQSLHHDISRQSTNWLENDSKNSVLERDPIPGWEYDRAAYNEAMAGPNAPSSLLCAMNNSGEAYIGVQKNQIEQYGCREGYCRVLNGVAGEVFRMIRKNEYLIVLQVNPGVMFTGDFPHAGVRNVQIHSHEDLLMTSFYSNVREILSEFQEDEETYEDLSERVFEMMCNFSNLNKICRFHCSTEPLDGPLEIPRNTVGFEDCYPNNPDKLYDDKIYREQEYSCMEDIDL